MASANTTDIGEKKKMLKNNSKKIDDKLYSELLLTMGDQKTEQNARDHFISQLHEETLKPWKVADHLKALKYPEIAKEFESFAIQFNYPKEDSIKNKPELVVMELIKYIRDNLTEKELFRIKLTKSKSFESIFQDLLERGKMEPSLKNLQEILRDEDREDMVTQVVLFSDVTSIMSLEEFQNTVQFCLDTMDVDIFNLLAELRVALNVEYETFHSIGLKEKTFKWEKDFIPLTFTEEVDKKTLPLTEGSDSELQTLNKLEEERREGKQTQYVDVHTEIYSTKLSCKLIALIGHPGTGKSFFCRKIINEFANRANKAFRFVFLITCRDPGWHALEEYGYNDTSSGLESFLKLMLPIFPGTQEIANIILKTEGRGLLLIIDSFDEYPQKFSFAGTLLCSILKRKCLSRATVLITSRPGAWNQLLRRFGSDFNLEKSWQLIGFSPYHRAEYIKQMLSENNVPVCNEFLTNHPELDILTLIPVNLSLLTSLIDSPAILATINTLTDMYNSLVLFKLEKELQRVAPESPVISSIDKLPSDMRNDLMILSELCFYGLRTQKITFVPEKLSDLLTGKYKEGLGLFNVVSVKTSHLSVVNYLSCPHLTFQEYLAAWHLSHKPTEDIISIVKQIFLDESWPAMKVCIRFLLGILEKDQNAIITIIIDNLQQNNLPLLEYKLESMNTSYTTPYSNISSTYLSILPYLLECKDPSILQSYYHTMCPYNASIPHFYLDASTSPVHTYSLSQFLSKLPHNNALSVLYIDTTLLNNIQLDTLTSLISSIDIDTLALEFKPNRNERINFGEYKQLYQQCMEDTIYELQQLQMRKDDRNVILEELRQIDVEPTVDKWHRFQFIRMSINLPASYLISLDYSSYGHVFDFISSITHAPTHKPKQIKYRFANVNLLDDYMSVRLLNSINATAYYAAFKTCYFTHQFMSLFVTSQPLLEYLGISEYPDSLKKFRLLLNQPVLDCLCLYPLKLKGLALQKVMLVKESTLYEYLQTQNCLEEINIDRITDFTLEILNSIQHMTGIKYIDVIGKDEALMKHHTTTDVCQSALLNILNNNRETISLMYLNNFTYFLEVGFNEIMAQLYKCSNLQCLTFHDIQLAPKHMHTIATIFNQMPSVICLFMDYGNLNDECLNIFCQFLKNNENIIWINFSECKLTSSSTPDIMSLMDKCSNLLHVELSENTLDDKSAKELNNLAKSRKINLII